MENKLVGLVRVSTDRQGESGLGMEAQESAIEGYRRAIGGAILKTYVEVESGMHDDVESRPQLRAAVAHARRAGAVLTIAKIDRMVRSTVVMAYLKTSKVRFVACDNPFANELTIDILVAVAADEGRRISVRTRDALRAYKSGKRVSKRIRALYPSGVPAEIVESTAGKLGASLPQCRSLTAEARARGAKASAASRTKKAVEDYADLMPLVLKLRADGETLQRIADRLDEEGHRTRRGKSWSPTQVLRILRRFAGEIRP